MKKIKAFTLVELLVTLVVFSILISIGISAYLHINQLSGKTMAQQGKNESMLFFYSLLKEDFSRAIVIRESFEGVTMDMLDRQDVYYGFHKAYIVRELKFRKDTFYLPHELPVFTKIENADFVEQMEMVTYGEDIIFPVRLRKVYTRDVLFGLGEL